MKNPSYNISEGSYCGNLNAGFLGRATDIVVPYYKKNFEDCGAFANLFDLRRKEEKFLQGTELAPAAPSNSELLFLGEITAHFHVADLSLRSIPLRNLSVTCSLRKHLRVFVDLL